MMQSMVVRAHAGGMALAGSGDLGDVQERVVGLPGVSIQVLQSHSAHQLLVRPFVRSMSLNAMLAASGVCLLFHLALSFEPCVPPTIWSSTGCASRS